MCEGFSHAHIHMWGYSRVEGTEPPKRNSLLLDIFNIIAAPVLGAAK